MNKITSNVSNRDLNASNLVEEILKKTGTFADAVRKQTNKTNKNNSQSKLPPVPNASNNVTSNNVNKQRASTSGGASKNVTSNDANNQGVSTSAGAPLAENDNNDNFKLVKTKKNIRRSANLRGTCKDSELQANYHLEQNVVSSLSLLQLKPRMQQNCSCKIYGRPELFSDVSEKTILMGDKTITIVSYNCRSFRRTESYISKLCNEADVILLQETWFLEFETVYLRRFHPSFEGTGTSAVDSGNGPLVGRPYGGVGILYKKTFTVTQIDLHNPRLLCIKIQQGDIELLIINVYMPTAKPENFEDFTTCLGIVNAAIEDHSRSNFIVMGDFNAHPGSLFWNELLSFCEENHLRIHDYACLPSDTFTYVSDAHGSLRWLDHCITSEGILGSIQDFKVHTDVVWSDHRPLFVIIASNGLNRSRPYHNYRHRDIATWMPRNPSDIIAYSLEVINSLDRIVCDNNLQNCNLRKCTDTEHRTSINYLYHSIVDVLRNAASTSFSSPTHQYNDKRFKVVPGWNDQVAARYLDSRNSFIEWVAAGRPSTGEIADRRRHARHVFKIALKVCQRNANQSIMDKIALYHRNKEFKQFWNATNAILAVNSTIPVHINGIYNHRSIANMFSKHFKESDLMGRADMVMSISEDSFFVITGEEVETALRSMSGGKATGWDSISTDHVLHSGKNFFIILARLFNVMILHEHVPEEFSRTTIVPVLKSSKLDASVFMNDCLTEEQSGYRVRYSTEMAIQLIISSWMGAIDDSNMVVAAVFLDFKRVFETID
ncbi:uncharacterized protein LOC143914136 [Arctopsyche grandis]|uniref:uncharacterized protein LOC143914136 n=1 Tax=Arctopsyche grandis TaxID=121162 RepID=UPI00406D7F9A